MRIFVTGASGFIGSHVSETLSKEHEIAAMARSERSAEAVRKWGAEPVRCSLTDIGAEHLEGVGAVVHAAAFVEEYGTREQFWNINVGGTSRLLDAARSAGVQRFIHIGTEAAIFDGHDLVDVDETAPYPARQRFLYSETKAEAERRVLAAGGDGFVALSVRPRLVWGPRDATVLPAIVRMARAGNYAWIDQSRQKTSTTHVANLVEGVRRALERGKSSEAYFVADAEQTTIRDFLTRLAATQGVDLGTRSAPRWLVRPAADIVEGAWRLLRRTSTPPLTRFAAYMMSATVTVDTSKAQRELGYQPVISVDEGMAALAAE